MKSLESLASEAAIRRLVLARVVAAVIVVTAIVFAPHVADSVVTLKLSASELADQMYGVEERLAEKSADEPDTKAVPVEPLSMSY